MTTSRHLYAAGDEPAAGSGYRLATFLGSGAFGQVWRAAGPGGTAVALKIVDLGDRKAYKELRALTVIKQLQHPHLVPVFGFWIKDADGHLLDEHDIDEVARQGAQTKTLGSGTTAVNATTPVAGGKMPVAGGKMPVAGGTIPAARGTMIVPRYRPPLQLIIAMGLGHKSLAERLEECQAEGLPGVPPAELLRYMDGVARALDHLAKSRTEAGVIVGGVQHGDIKPSNVLIVGDAAQVCDFGLARVLTDNRQTALAGSPIYMAPEMFAQTTPSAAGDQYSLAITYYELRTGQLPMAEDAASNWMEVWKIHSEGRLDLSVLEPAERAVIARATAVAPAERFASCCEMVDALREAIERRPAAPEAPAGAVAVATPRTRVRTFAMLAGLLAVIAAGVWGGSKFRSDPAAVDSSLRILPLDGVTIRAGDPPTALPIEFVQTGLGDEVPIRLRIEGNIPRGILAETDEKRPIIRFSADVSAEPRSLALKVRATAGGIESEAPLELAIEAVRPRLPQHCRVAAGSAYQKVGESWYADKIEYVGDGFTVPLLFINSDDPPRFYIMADKLTNVVYRRFAEEQPEAAGKSWELGWGHSDAAEHDSANLPVLNVTWKQAAACAAWLGGRLPSAKQWDTVAKRSADDGYLSKIAAGGPLEVAIGRKALGPLAVGAAADDRTPTGGHDRGGSAYYCRDMWGNGYEWTRDTLQGDEMTPEAGDYEDAMIKLRSQNWQAAEALRPEYLSSGEPQFSNTPHRETGFRVVIDEWR